MNSGIVGRPWVCQAGAERSPGALPSDENLERSLRRARQRVRQGLRHRGLDRLLTLTYRENMEDEARVRRDWSKFLRRLKEHHGWEFPFVCVRERQKRGAWHLHVGVRGWRDVGVLRAAWRHVVGLDNGNIDIRRPRRGGAWRSSRLAGYLAKYLGKDFGPGRGKSYWISQGAPLETVRFLSFQEDVRQVLAEVLSCMPSGAYWWVPPGEGLIWGSG